MKKVCLLLTCLIALSSAAQNTTVSLSLEPNLSWLKPKGTSSAGYGSGIGVNLKVPGTIKLKSFLELETRPGLSYYQNRLVDYGQTEYYDFFYASLPCYIKLIVQEEFSFHFGFNFEYQLHKSITGDAANSVSDFFTAEFNYGPSAGVSYSFQGPLRVFAFYSYGLSSFVEDLKIIDDQGNPLGDVKMSLNSFSLGLSYTIFGRK